MIDYDSLKHWNSKILNDSEFILTAWQIGAGYWTSMQLPFQAGCNSLPANDEPSFIEITQTPI